MQIPPDFTPSQKRIVHEYSLIMETTPVAGSSLYRLIASRLYYSTDKNKTNSYIRKVVKRFLQEPQA